MLLNNLGRDTAIKSCCAALCQINMQYPLQLQKSKRIFAIVGLFISLMQDL